MRRQIVYFITHPDVVIDPQVPVPDWPLSARGRERMQQALLLPWMANIRAVWSSTERKARDGADILGGALGLPVQQLAALGENDRSATGYLPPAEFEQVATLFFANPAKSIRGWERAIGAQARIVRAMGDVILQSSECGGDIAVVSHGGVGTLLLCQFAGRAIGRESDQPGTSGGNYFTFGAADLHLESGWTPIDVVTPATPSRHPR